MAKGLVPAIYQRALFKLSAPFDADSPDTTLYTVMAIRTFKELIKAGVNVSATYYTGKGLTDADYTADAGNTNVEGAVIVTLFDASASKVINVPSTYISDIVPVDSVGMDACIVTANLGVLPPNTDFVALLAALKSATETTLGMSPTFNVGRIPSVATMTVPQVKKKTDELAANKEMQVTPAQKAVTAQSVLKKTVSILNTANTLLKVAGKVKNVIH